MISLAQLCPLPCLLAQVFLYKLSKDAVVRKHALQLYSTEVRLSACDNLLLVHTLDAKVVMLFDLRINAHSAIAAPLPLRLLSADGFGPLYSVHWIYATPSYIIDPQATSAAACSAARQALRLSEPAPLARLRAWTIGALGRWARRRGV